MRYNLEGKSRTASFKEVREFMVVLYMNWKNLCQYVNDLPRITSYRDIRPLVEEIRFLEHHLNGLRKVILEVANRC